MRSANSKLRFSSSLKRMSAYFDKSFACHLCSVGDTGENIRFLKLWVLLKYLMDAHPARQHIQDERYPDAMSANAWLAEAHIRVNTHTLEQLFTGHGEMSIPCLS